MRFLIILCAALFMIYGKRNSYNGYKVYRLYPENENQLSVLAKFNDTYTIQFLSALRLNNKPIDVMVHPKAQSLFKWILTWQTIPHDILIENVETIVQRERTLQMKVPLLPKSTITFKHYCRFHEINSYLDELERSYRNIVKVQIIGHTFKKRSMKIIQISRNPHLHNHIIFIDAGIHGKNWIAPAMALYIINQLVENNSNEYLLKNVDWHILPLLNPDGYEYTFNKDRFWRKTLSWQTVCNGVDANRNFDFHWGEANASTSACSQMYKGPFAFSEIETLNVKKYIENRKHRIKLYISLHGSGNYLLYPWGYTTQLPEDYAILYRLAKSVNEAIVIAGGDPYDIGTFSNILYTASGVSYDWVKGSAEIELSYAMKLPGGSYPWFDPDPENISSVVNVTFFGIKVFGEYIAKEFGP